MRHRMLHNKLKQDSVSHCTSSSGSGDIIERATTPIPDPGDDEYWMDCSNNVQTANNVDLCGKKNKYCFFCNTSYSKLGNRKQRLRHINFCKKQKQKQKKQQQKKQELQNCPI